MREHGRYALRIYKTTDMTYRWLVAADTQEAKGTHDAIEVARGATDHATSEEAAAEAEAVLGWETIETLQESNDAASSLLANLKTDLLEAEADLRSVILARDTYLSERDAARAELRLLRAERAGTA